jgi:hypothetical protein
MKSRFTLTALLLDVITSSGFTAAPENLDGYIYYESARTIARSAYSFAATFPTTGRTTELFSRSTGANAAGGTSKILAPLSGPFVYRKIDEMTAELTLSDTFVPGKRTLRFLSDLSGTIEFDSLAATQGSFRLAPLSARSPLVNCSNRSFASSTNPAFTGFVITGNISRTMVVRAVGPGLAPFGIADFLRNPAVTVVRSRDNAVIDTNNDWSDENAESIGRTAAAVGAFPLPAASKDAALILTLAPGAYVAQVTSPETGDSGQALIEVYMLP